MTVSNAATEDRTLPPAKPFLKWAGGKKQLLPALLARIPDSFSTYYEPFIGGGALFFALKPSQAVIADVNEELIATFQVIKDSPYKLIDSLSKHRHCRDYYYELRALDRNASFQKLSKVERASRTIYLNKTCFNGLYRVNAKGEFNTPFGSYKNPRFLDSENLLACHQVLQSTSIQCASFESVLSSATKGDFVYLDPPYAPLTPTSNFTGYSKGGFGESKQVQLRDVCKSLDSRGVRFLASNSSAPLILELYKDFHISTVSATRAINAVGSKRGKVTEVLITNY